MNLYENHYTQFHFERAGLFKAMQKRYQCRDVLYPGCSIHITPSFYFPHVVYVDQDEAAAQFFADKSSIAAFVNRHKQYKPSAYISFIQQDYSQPLPLRQGTFDLVLSLFASGIARSCAQYLRTGGHLLTNNHQGDGVDAVNNPRFKLSGMIQFHKGAYTVSEEGLESINLRAGKSDHQYLKQADQGLKYVENETYYVFERSR